MLQRLDQLNDDIDSLREQLFEVADKTKAFINGWLYDQFEGRVQDGPFKGMWLPREEFWQDGNLGPKLLGCYEQELHPAIEQEIVRLGELEKPKIVNIGCAEGFYAVGMAMRLPHADVWAVDEIKAREIATMAATANGTKLIIDGTVENYMDAPHLIISDCEGAETVYLNPSAFPLAKTTMIVECHNFEGNEATQIMYERFNGSHEVWIADEGVRNPNKFQCLRGMHSTLRWLAVSEGRPCHMHWLLMYPKDKS